MSQQSCRDRPTTERAERWRSRCRRSRDGTAERGAEGPCRHAVSRLLVSSNADRCLVKHTRCHAPVKPAYSSRLPVSWPVMATICVPVVGGMPASACCRVGAVCRAYGSPFVAAVQQVGGKSPTRLVSVAGQTDLGGRQTRTGLYPGQALGRRPHAVRTR